MCLTIPKKVISIEENGLVTVELPGGNRQEVKSIVDIEVGDFVLTQQNIIIQQIDDEYAREIIEIVRKQGGK